MINLLRARHHHHHHHHILWKSRLEIVSYQVLKIFAISSIMNFLFTYHFCLFMNPLYKLMHQYLSHLEFIFLYLGKNSIQRSENTKMMETYPKNKMVIMNPKLNTEESTNLDKMKNRKVWDCESTLYDSFELNSFNRQLNSAISSSARSMSMPHLSSPPPPSETTSSSTKKQQSPTKKISRSLGKLIKSMFKQKQSNALFKTGHSGVDMDKYYFVFDKTGSLTTIPESGESTEMVGSEINSLVRKTTSERIPQSRLVGISSS